MTPPSHTHRGGHLALKQGRMSMLEYIHVHDTSHLHHDASGGHGDTVLLLDAEDPSTLEEAFAVALREDDTVTASQASTSLGSGV
ncbi:hypothetical protein GQ600_23023 [Phytophthora cactorum]|nr:hypothetical protein GQ600_23023 [Phytophthora cactorum]